MKINITILLLLLISSCNTPEKNKNNMESEVQNSTLKTADDQTVTAQATVLSVGEELLMPADYLTTAMTVKTESGDTLVFLDMDGTEKLIGQKIPVKYKMEKGSEILVCFDCHEFAGKVKLHDITSVASDVSFEKLQLKKYIQDEFIDIASIYTMLKEDGQQKDYYALDYEFANDSVKMASGFFQYGIITKFSPELENREEILQMTNP